MKTTFTRIISLMLAVSLAVLLVGCTDQNVLYKDKIYTITKGEEKVTVSVNEGAKAPSVHEAGRQYIDIMQPYLYVLNFQDGILTVSSHDYDADAKDNFKLWELQAAKDISFNSIIVFDKNGKVTVSDDELTEKDEYLLGDFYNCGYLEFNASGEVSHITFYGEIIV